MLSSLEETRLLMASVLSFEEQLKSFLSVLFCVLVVIVIGQLLTSMALGPVVFEAWSLFKACNLFTHLFLALWWD